MLGALSACPKETVDGPTAASGNSICVLVNRFIVSSENSPDWCLWADRFFEIAVLAINHCSTGQATEDILSNVWFSTKQTIDELLPISFWPNRVPEDFRWEFLANYGD
jgi:hypothetical protein